MRSALSITAFAAACLLVGTGATAQMPPPPPMPLPPGPGLEAAPATPPVEGRIQRWLVNPNGEVDGFLMADGMQVAFPPHLSAAVLQSFKPGDAVQVVGWRVAEAPVLRAASLTATATGRQVLDQPPPFGSPKPRPPEPGALSAMSASGRVSNVLYTGRGDANGVLLDSGTIVRFPPHLGAALAPQLQPGKTLYARGWGSRGAQGSAIEATAIGASADSQRELFAGPAVPGRGPGGPGPDAPRQRPGP